MARKPRMIAVDYPHHIVQRGNNKQDIFFDEQDKQIYMEFLGKCCAEYNCKINSFCLMLNHTHVLMTPQFNYSISKAMHKIGFKYTQHINRKYQRTGRLWESRFYSSIVSNDHYLYRVLRYIERNPVRALLVKTPHQYKWSSANCYESSCAEFNMIDVIWKDEIDKLSYIKFLSLPDTENDINLIRTCTISGKPVGNIGSSVRNQRMGTGPN